MAPYCRAPLNYAPRSGAIRVGPVVVEVEIHDARRSPLPGWQECGFELVRHTSGVADWTDDDQICEVHYPEAEDLARRLTGCGSALVSDHVKRSGAPVPRPREQQPVRLVHSDFAANYESVIRHAYGNVRGRGAATLARSGLSPDDIENASRIMVLQLWRNLGASRIDLPVGFCDARTVTPEQTRPFRYTGYVAGGQSFDALAVVAPTDPSDHAWYCYPGMTPGEVVAFRTYDTDLVRQARTWFTPHSAFRDPGVEDGQPPRFSIEMRVVCLFA